MIKNGNFGREKKDEKNNYQNISSVYLPEPVFVQKENRR
jgi:hypothetical protein